MAPPALSLGFGSSALGADRVTEDREVTVGTDDDDAPAEEGLKFDGESEFDRGRIGNDAGGGDGNRLHCGDDGNAGNGGGECVGEYDDVHAGGRSGGDIGARNALMSAGAGCGRWIVSRSTTIDAVCGRSSAAKATGSDFNGSR